MATKHSNRPANRRLDACSSCFSSEMRKFCSSLKVLNETLYLCIKKTMYIEYRKNDKDSFLKAIMSEKDRVAHQRESLIRHCTMTSATLIGLVTVFGDTSSQCMSLRVLTVCGVLFLLLSVLVGVCFCFWSVSMLCKELENAQRQYRARNTHLEELPVSPVYGILAKVFPWLLSLGVLLLSASIVLSLLIH